MLFRIVFAFFVVFTIVSAKFGVTNDISNRLLQPSQGSIASRLAKAQTTVKSVKDGADQCENCSEDCNTEYTSCGYVQVKLCCLLLYNI